ncbi:uncharacterized protein NP_4062A [Natronomonas pharaonis DSM 2160]|uniref:Uncharacterized protein n=1 Tax=Natronomonas pharaonis (strain ATCC 35678 / DSM 2160 / CIP 103997 / JCM 8858 / NBRC 14720 / NCIMB 2260 / Gabara) TaxID=348780 RepID=A0A1U7EY44_NATPD|nr:hypothetical protein [Natronomonas pharaonis]CAI50122.1 uncharacterized protein NP_4062A [Natronomonas pharaonis DSM 2160]
MGSDETTYGRRARIIVVVLVVITGLSALARAVEGGATGAIEGGLLLYVALVLAYGVFTGALETPSVQAAFGVGLAGYGGLLYGTGGGVLWLGLAAVGGLLAAHSLRQAVEAR